MTTIDPKILSKAQAWLNGNYDEETKKQVRQMVDHDPVGLVDAFYQDLEFGTGGLRGIMGVGSNRMNRYTVGMATQGLANYLMQQFRSVKVIKVAIAYDCRNNNTFFADTTTDVLTANGIKVYLFDALRPTPELSFAVRELGCHCGIVITASHNPKEYNGYKVYWEDGGQLVNPHDVNVIAEVQKIGSVDDVKWVRKTALVEMIGEEIDKRYLQKVVGLSLSPALISKHSDFSIVYTPIHGSGVQLVPAALKQFGFQHVHSVPEQDEIDGNFPTVKSPNPEEKATLDMAIAKARQVGADMVMATDPDADRVGIAVKNEAGEFILLNGNQAATILIYYLISKWKENNKLTGQEFIVKTIVTSELLKEIAQRAGVEVFDVLTGFKFIAEIIKRYEGVRKFIGGGEESYGYLVGDFVRDKDAVISCCVLAEAAVWAREKGKTMYELLKDIYVEFGLYKEQLVNVVRTGKAGADEIKAMMAGFRSQPVKTINRSPVISIKDYQLQIEKLPVTGEEKSMDHLPKSNVIQFFTENGSKVTVRPSGTEPKIKFYISIKETLEESGAYERVNQELEGEVNNILIDLGLKN